MGLGTTFSTLAGLWSYFDFREGVSGELVNGARQEKRISWTGRHSSRYQQLIMA